MILNFLHPNHCKVGIDLAPVSSSAVQRYIFRFMRPLMEIHVCLICVLTSLHPREHGCTCPPLEKMKVIWWGEIFVVVVEDQGLM